MYLRNVALIRLTIFWDKRKSNPGWMHLPLEEETKHFWTLKVEELAASCGTGIKVQLASPSPPVWGSGEISKH